LLCFVRKADFGIPEEINSKSNTWRPTQHWHRL